QQPCDIILLINNPFRWKGYYYDVETELYYCNYMYYSPLLCSWISPDSLDYLDPETVGGIDFTNGIKFGVGLGLGYEIFLNIDWYKLFH
ncbi:MAG: hypothetical protein IJB21_07215, partial [Bacilli bacterium]|nr:hypothetical protein [Bacilli bacterium]